MIFLANRGANLRHTDVDRYIESMIYRILVNNREYGWDKSSREFIFKPDGSLVGAGMAGLITDPPLKIPKLENRRVRFFFTEKGWRDIGQSIVAEAIRKGHVVRVIRRKNPAKSQIFYQDIHQAAILPSRRKGRYNEWR